MAEWRIGRALLDVPETDEGDVVTDYAADEDMAHDDTQTLRIVSIFVILAAGLLGGLPPLFIKLFRDPDSTFTRVVRSFAAGVIAALALVHIIPEAVEEMAELGGIEYPLGGTCVLFGVALMILLEHLAHIMNGNSVAASPGGSSRSFGHQHSHQHGSSRQQPQTIVSASTGLERALSSEQQQQQLDAVPSAAVADMKTAGSDMRGPEAAGHSHVCVSRGAASNWVSAAAVEAMGSLRLKIVAYLFEIGCIFHSFIIGLSLGVNQTDLTEVRSLLIALAFHQWLEGISLASVVIRGGFSLWRGSLMILTYSLTCPVGIAVGMGIAKTYDAESERARGVQGAFNGVSGGMLLYISLVQLVAEDMGRLVPGRDSARSRLTCFGALCAGAASMCLLAIWA